ncbi:hypothetical protein JCM8547_007923 [Rhodosporidiobolus lusitaniae]
MDTDPAQDSSTSTAAAPSASAEPAVAVPLDSSATTRHKRPRAAVDPGTPRGNESETKGLSSMTPLAKKGRVEDEEEAGSDSGRTTPPPSAVPTDSSSRPATPAQAGAPLPIPGTEGKETRKIRERVAAMKPPGEDSQEVEETSPESKQDTVIADVAAEVSTSAAKLGDAQDAKEEKDVEIAEVAAEVGKSAERVDAPVKESMESEEAQEEAETAAEVSEAAAPVQAEDEKLVDTAAEVAEAAKAALKPTPAPPPKPAVRQPNFAEYTGTSSPFSAFASTTSPLASGGTPVKPATFHAEVQRPKATSSFPASPFLASKLPSAVPSTTSTSTAAKPIVAPSTPSFTKSAPTTNLAAASPFSAFASTSGFASASKPSGSSALGGGGGAAAASGSATPSAFSAFSTAPSAFSTPLGKSSAGKSALDVAKESPAPSGSTSSGAANDDEEEKKPVYTEQERFTGEEGEEVVHQVRCKMFVMEAGQWKERGTGPIRVNESRKEGGEGGKGSGRLVMRADATHRLLLNAPLFREFSIEVSNDKYVRFTVIEGSEPVSYMLRLGNPNVAQALVQAVRDKVATL